MNNWNRVRSESSRSEGTGSKFWREPKFWKTGRKIGTGRVWNDGVESTHRFELVPVPRG